MKSNGSDSHTDFGDDSDSANLAPLQRLELDITKRAVLHFGSQMKGKKEADFSVESSFCLRSPSSTP